MKKSQEKFLVGIDEVGRGPLAGPVAVGVAMGTKSAIKKFRSIKESKQLSPKLREQWYMKICAPDSGITFAVVFVSAKHVDKRGINPSIRTALGRGLKKLNPSPLRSLVLLDGGLRAPDKYENQKTIIRGDTTETIIAIASVVAKVERDRRMVVLHKKFPQYGFAAHKGYGTAAHIRAIKKHGCSPEHRLTFLRSILT